jgi:DNA-binding NtrC family response regulator
VKEGDRVTIPSPMRILVVDDEPQVLGFLEELFRTAGWEVQGAGTGLEGIEKLERGRFDVVLTDLKMPGAGGMEVLRTARKLQADAEVVLMTAYGSVDTAIDAMRAGAFHYLTKPFKAEEVLNLVEKAYAHRRLRRENLFLKAESRSGHLIHSVVGTGAAIQEVAAAVQRLADTETPVLFAGERGTGRAFFARILHFHSSRAASLFVPVQCAGTGDDTLERELFGHAAGAYDRAVLPHPGKVAMADHGTLYLSEIGDAGPRVQERLVELLRTRTVLPVSGERRVETDVRLVASTSRPLAALAAQGRFHRELQEMLAAGTIVLPALRERAEDIPLLLHHFLFEANRKRKKPLRGFSQAALSALGAHPWPGNVRELVEFVEAVSSRKKQGTVVDAADIPTEILYGRKARRAPEPAGGGGADDVGSAIEELEKPMVLQALALAEGDLEKAAELLRIDLPALEELLRRYGRRA